MRFDLATLMRRARNPRRKSIVLREIVPTLAFATDLFPIYKRVVIAITSRLPPRECPRRSSAALRPLRAYVRNVSRLQTSGCMRAAIRARLPRRDRPHEAGAAGRGCRQAV